MSDSPLYAEWCVTSAPPWLQAEDGEDWLEAFGIASDAFVSAATLATAARFPSKAPIGGLDKIGEGLSLPRCEVREPIEADASYASRLKRAESTWAKLGHEDALTDLCSLLGLTDVQVHDRKTWAVQKKRDVVIHVRQPHPWTGPKTYGSGWKYGDGTTVGITGMTARQADALRRLFRPFCPSHCRLLFKVTFTGVVYGGGWHYGDGTKFGGKTANIWIKG